LNLTRRHRGIAQESRFQGLGINDYACDLNSFVGGYPIPHFNQAKANLIEFIKARGRALDREQVSNGSLTHPPAISIPGNKAVTSDLPIGSA
jgi:hypothetical protein